MNERIRELAKLATQQYSPTYYTQEWIQGFAELIVKECLAQVEDQYKPVKEDITMMQDTHWKGYVQCGVDSYVAIREHFGVEL